MHVLADKRNDNGLGVIHSVVRAGVGVTLVVGVDADVAQIDAEALVARDAIEPDRVVLASAKNGDAGLLVEADEVGGAEVGLVRAADEVVRTGGQNDSNAGVRQRRVPGRVGADVVRLDSVLVGLKNLDGRFAVSRDHVA